MEEQSHTTYFGLHDLFDELSDTGKKIRKKMNRGYAMSLAGVGIMLSGNFVEGSMILYPFISGFFLYFWGLLYNDDLKASRIGEEKKNKKLTEYK